MWSRLRGGSTHLARMLVLGIAAAGACGTAPSAAGDGTTGTGTGTGGPSPERPRFLQPADGVIALSASRHEDVVLAVENVVPGRTQLVVDGTSAGTLLDAPRLGKLEGQVLTLFLHGGLVAGLHTMELWTPAEEDLRSRTVEVRIAPDDARPALVVAATDRPPVPAVELRGQGGGSREVFLVRRPAGTGEAVGWFGLAPETAPGDADLPWPAEVDPVSTLDLAAAAVFDPGDRGRRILWVARGAPGPGRTLRRICARYADGAWTTEETMDVLAAADGVSGVEWVDLVRVSALESVALVERVALKNVETPPAGSHRLLWVRAPCGGNVQVEELPLAPGEDVAGLVPFPDLADLRHDLPIRTFLAGAGAGRPLVFDVDPQQPWVRVRYGPPPPGPVSVEAGAVGMLSAFSGVVLAALAPSGLVYVGGDTRDGSAAFVDAHPLAAPPSGRPAAAVVAGFPVFAVPRGPGEPVALLVSNGASLEVPDLAGEVPACDAVAFARSYGGNLGEPVPVLCLAGGVVSFYELSAALP